MADYPAHIVKASPSNALDTFVSIVSIRLDLARQRLPCSLEHAHVATVAHSVPTQGRDKIVGEVVEEGSVTALVSEGS